MTSQRKVLKMFVIIILVIFLASTALMSVLYLSNQSAQEEVETITGDVIEEIGDTTTEIDKDIVLTGDLEETFE